MVLALLCVCLWQQDGGCGTDSKFTAAPMFIQYSHYSIVWLTDVFLIVYGGGGLWHRGKGEIWSFGYTAY